MFVKILIVLFTTPLIAAAMWGTFVYIATNRRLRRFLRGRRYGW